MFKRLTATAILLFMITIVTMAQSKVSGTVVFASDGEPLIGAAVEVVGTKTKTVTDMNGKFTLNVPAGKKIKVSYVGCKPMTLTAKNGMKISMEDDSKEMTEVVINGFQQMDKRMFTGASTKVDADKVMLSGEGDVSRSLEGRVAGVQVTNVSSTFGAAPKIRVRGATSIYGNSKPLWVIDGVIFEDNVDVSADELSSGDAKTIISSAVAGLNSDDIESFTVLKDGSATSIYGARAMAGVIVITTKKGQKGHARVGYTGEFSSHLRPNYRNYNIMNSQENMSLYREMEDKGWLSLENIVNSRESGIYGYMFQQLRKYDSATGLFGLPNTQAARNAYLQAAEMRNTDWFDILFRNSFSQNHSVSISMGGEKSQSYFSMSLMDDNGIYVNRGDVRRYTFNGNTSYDILKNLTVKLAAQGTHISQETPGTLNKTTDVVTGEVRRDFDINPFSYALNTSRCLDPNFNYTRFYSPFNILDELDRNYQEIDRNELMFRGELEYKPIKSITLSGLMSTRMTRSKTIHHVMDDSNQANAYRAGTDATDDNSTIRYSNPLLYTDPDDEEAIPVSILPKGGIKYQKDNNMNSYNFRFNAAYNNVWNDKHTLNAMIGTEYTTVHREEVNWTGWGYQYYNGGITYTPYIWLKMYNEENTEYFGDSWNQNNTLAYYGTATYNFDQRYTLSGTLRYEGTNRLGKATKSRWLPTWNVSGSYDIMGEHFMESIREKGNLSALRLRGSYSLTADTGPAWVTNATTIYHTENVWRPSKEAQESQIYISQIANTELTFEKKHEANVGFELAFLRDRIALNFDAYWRNNFDLIGTTYTQGAGGAISKMANVADMKARGAEIGLSTINVKNKFFTWSTDFIYSLAKNKITNLKTDGRVIDLVTATGYGIEGYPCRALFSYQFTGLNEEGIPMHINELGKETIGDINMQETENLTDFLKYEGSIDPTWYGSLNNTFSFDMNKWGKLNLDVFITYSGGNVIRMDHTFSYTYSDLKTFPREFKNRWMMSGDENVTTIPTIASKSQVDRYGSYELSTAYNAYNYSTERVAKGDFIRLKEIALTYSMPNQLLKKTKFLSSVSMKLAATNLCLLYADKKLNGNDPEFVNAGGVASPMTRQITGTLRLGF